MARENNVYRDAQALKDQLITIFIFIFAMVWLFPIAWALWSSLRPYKEILARGIFTWPDTFTLNNYQEAFLKMHFGQYLLNTLIILIPSVLCVLIFAAFASFAIAKYKIRGSSTMLLLFTAGSMLPPQVIFQPIFKMYIWVGGILGNKNIFYDNYLGVILIHIAIHTGFAVLILSSFMKSIPKEISEASVVDGASVSQHFWQVILPQIKFPLASLGLIISVWIYNDFFWGAAMMRSDAIMPMTSALGRLGAFSRVIPDQNVLIAGSIIAALPLLLLYGLLRKRFMSGIIFGPVAKAK